MLWTRVLVLTALMFLISISSAILPTFASDEFFAPYVSYPTGNRPLSVTTGDFNGDGKVDLATANNLVHTVSILIGIGDGSFQTNIDYPTGSYPNCISAGDFNGDSKVDLATGNANGTVSILLGKGDGTFEANVDYPIGGSPLSITTSDFNGDGSIDIATANWWGNNVSILIGDGNGAFQHKVDYFTGWTRSITTGDFNGDGKADLAVASYPSAVSILIGNGDGTFLEKVDYLTGGYVTYTSIVAEDFDKDGKTDLAVLLGGSYHDSYPAIFIGKGDGTFQIKGYYYSAEWSKFLTFGDFNGDGVIDLATVNDSTERNDPGSVSILIGYGDGSFQSSITYPTGPYPGGRGPSFIGTGDFNGDGMADLVTIGYSSVSVLINIHNRPPVAFAGPDQIVECAGPSGASITLDGSASSDSDGDPLIYTWTWAGGSVEGINPTITLPLGITVITLTVSDGQATATDTVNITIRDSTPPITSATGGSDNWYNANVIATFSATDSCSGVKEIHYTVNGAETVIPGDSSSLTLTADGIYNIAYYSIDNAGNAESPKSMTVKIDKTPPVLNLSSTPNILWSPNREMVDVAIDGGASDNGSGIASVVFSVTDEYGKVQPTISGFNTSIALEAWREGNDKDGRHYIITATATDAAGNKSTASIEVLVPHDQR